MLAVAYMFTHHAAQRSLAQMILGGVFERHPDLRVVSVENDVGWIPTGSSASTTRRSSAPSIHT
jgi:hypothetical protein